MAERVVCLDTSVLIKYFTPDEQEEAAARLVLSVFQADDRLVAPAWTWAEVGSVLLKKVRAHLLDSGEARALWAAFLNLPIEFVDMPSLRSRAWEIADRYGLPTLYDAAFLACTEVVQGSEPATREFWTADHTLVRHLGAGRPAYVRELGAGV